MFDNFQFSIFNYNYFSEVIDMDFKEKIKQYPYGKEENDRILALSDEEFENEVYNRVENLETAEPMDLAFEQEKNREKYEYFRKLRSYLNTKNQKEEQQGSDER